MNCSKCSKNNVYEDLKQGEYSCNDCGYVWEIDKEIDDIEYQELVPGQKSRVGTLVDLNVSKQNTIRKTKSKLTNMALKTGLPQNVAELALSIYRKAVENKCTFGMRSNVMIAALLYLAARQINKPIMLLDLSSKVGENMFAVGRTYKMLKHRFDIHVSDIDPCLYIDRFMYELELCINNRQKQNKLRNTTVRIIQRFKKDWICTGRRPSAITAAALLLAARMHRIDRDYEDVARVCGVDKTTIRKRVEEFLATPSALLTLEQLDTIDLEEECNPPAFSKKSAIEKFDEDKAIFDNEKELEEQFNEIMKELDNPDLVQLPSIDYRSLLEKGETINSELLVQLVANEYEEFMETDNEELIGRLAELRRCIKGRPENDDDSDSAESKLDGDGDAKTNDECDKASQKKKKSDIHNESSDQLPSKIDCIDDTVQDYEINCVPYLTEEEIDRNIEKDIIPHAESHAILKWFFKNKDNRDFFRRKKDRDKKKKLQNTVVCKERLKRRRRMIMERKQKIIEDHRKSLETNQPVSPKPSSSQHQDLPENTNNQSESHKTLDDESIGLSEIDESISISDVEDNFDIKTEDKILSDPEYYDDMH